MIIVYISQFKFILIKLTLTTTEVKTNIRHETNNDLEKNR